MWLNIQAPQHGRDRKCDNTEEPKNHTVLIFMKCAFETSEMQLHLPEGRYLSGLTASEDNTFASYNRTLDDAKNKAIQDLQWQSG